jgi:hypothetical protein
LRVVETTPDSITLAWTAPSAQGDDIFYDARYLAASEMGGLEEITEELWAIADTVAGEPPVSEAGTEESLVIGAGSAVTRPWGFRTRIPRASTTS